MLRQLFSSDGLMPHGFCYQWQPALIWLHVITDTLIGLSYASIPVTLFQLVRKRKDIPFGWMFMLFATFITACGATHLMEVWTLWKPVYWLSGAVKSITALASVPTAVLLVRLLPTALSLPSHQDMELAHEQLKKQAAILGEQAALLDLSQDAILVRELNGTILFWNLGAVHVYGWLKGEAVGSISHDLLLTHFPIPQGEILEKLLKTGCWEGALQQHMRHGGKIWVSSRWILRRDKNGMPHSVLEINTDVTEQKKAQEEVAQWISRYEAAAMASGQLLYDWDPVADDLVLGGNIESVFGFTREEMKGGFPRWVDLIHPDDMPAFRKEKERALSQARPFHLEYRLRKKDGSYLTVRDDAHFYPTDGGENERMVGFVLDVTKQRMAEHDLRVSESRFRQMAENIQEIFWLLDPQTLEVLYVSPAFEQICERTLASLYSHPVSYRELIHPNDSSRVLAALEDLRNTEHFQEEFRIVCPSGVMKWVDVRGFTAKDGLGQVTALVGTAQDITQRKRAEDALRESEDRYRDLVEHSSDLICTHDLEGNLLSVNESPLRVLGYSSAELLNKPLRDFVTAEARPMCDAYLSQIQRDGFAKGLLPVLTKSGEVRLWEYSNTLRRDGVSSPIVRGIAHDVTEQKLAEKALRISEEKFSKAFRSSPVEMMITTLAEGQFIDVNESFESNIGYRRDEVLGRSSLELGLWLNPADRSAVITEIKKNGRVLNREIQIRSKSGQIGIKLYSAEPIQIGGKECLLAVSEDITARKRAEAALRESEERFRRVFEDGAIPMAIVGLDFRILSPNQALCMLLGRTEEELRELTFMGFTHPSDVARDEELARRLFAGIIPSYQMEKRYVKKDGEIVWGNLAASLIRAIDGTPLYALGVVVDITERKKAEQALQESEAEYRSLVVEAPYGICRVRRDGTFMFVNDALVEMLGYDSTEELLSKNLEFDVYEDPEERVHIIERMAQLDHLRKTEVHWKRKDGTSILVRTNTRPVHNNSGDIGSFETMAEDITQQRALEEQMRQVQKMEAIALLAGGIAHDFNNILTGILGYGELLCKTLDSVDPRKRKLQNIVDAALQGRALTAKLLAFSRDEILPTYPVSLDAEIFQMEDMIRRLIGEKVEVRFHVNSAPGKVLLEPSLIYQIVLNLAVNARDAMPRGGLLTIRTSLSVISAAQSEPMGIPEGRYTRIEIRDTGCGMNKEVRERIFEPFFTTKGLGKGTGLGLYTVYGIVRQCSGHIRVHSEIGVGSTFEIYFPLLAPSALAQHTEPETEPSGGEKEVILVVEDDSRVRGVLQDQLKDLGYLVLCEAKAAEAVRMIERLDQRIDLLLTDVVMPELNGPELSRKLRETLPNLKILYMTGYANEDVLPADALADGAALLRKPFTMRQLDSTICHLLHPPETT